MLSDRSNDLLVFFYLLDVIDLAYLLCDTMTHHLLHILQC